MGIYVSVLKKVFNRSLSVIALPILAWFGFLFAFRFLDNYADYQASTLEFQNSTDGSSESMFDRSWPDSFIHLITMSLGNYENDKMGLDKNSFNINYVVYLLAIFFLSLLIINLFIGITIDELRTMIKDSQNHNVRLNIKYMLTIQDVLVNILGRFEKWNKFISWSVLFVFHQTWFNQRVLSYLIPDSEQANARLKEFDSREKTEFFMKQLSLQMSQLEDRLNRQNVAPVNNYSIKKNLESRKDQLKARKSKADVMNAEIGNNSSIKSM